jgi:predicted nucleic-acid-binding protein
MSLALQGTIDTNILLRFILKDVPDQFDKAKALIEGSTGPYYVSLLSIAEIVFILEGAGFNREEVKRNIDFLCGYPILYINRLVVLQALELYVSHPALSFIDACLAYEADAEYAPPLLTFDKKLAKQAPQAQLLK